MKANLLTMEPEFRARWERLDIHGQQLETKHENGPWSCTMDRPTPTEKFI